MQHLEKRVKAVANAQRPLNPEPNGEVSGRTQPAMFREFISRSEKSVGNQFSGRLRQTYQDGTSDVMEISGMRVGNDVNFHTTGMRMGKLGI